VRFCTSFSTGDIFNDITERAERLAANLLADRQREQPKHNILPCFSCGYTFVYRGRQGDLNGNFCSMRCQAWFDDGNPTYEQQQTGIVYRWRDGRPMKRAYNERQTNLAAMTEAGIEPATKRRCAAPGCEATIPKWKNGRRVSSKVTFCSPKCRQRAKRAAA
jgi:hypothetical protein